MKIFISYRRADTTYLVGRIRDRLMATFGEHSVFRDLDDIPAGVDFRTVLEKEMQSCQVMLVIIGPLWLSVTDAQGNKRLLDPRDITRIEVETGLKRLLNKQVVLIPLLVMNAGMPSAQDLPESLNQLAFQNAMNIRNDPDFNNDIRNLIRTIQDATGFSSGGRDNATSEILSPLISIAEQREILLDPIPAVGSFLNRENDVKGIKKFVTDQVSRLIIIQGLPGIGKTSLVAKAMQDLDGQRGLFFWFKCKADQVSPDILFGKLHVFFKRQGEPSFGNISNDPRINLEIKINKLIEILEKNSYLLVFDEFENWVVDAQVQNTDLTQVLTALLRSDHLSKVFLISRQRLQFDPVRFKLPAGVKKEQTLHGLSHSHAARLLQKTGVKIKERNLLDQIIDYCDGNPSILQLVSYFIHDLHRDPQDLLTTREPGKKFKTLFENVIEGLSFESRDILELLSILRRPLRRQQFRSLAVRFDITVGPLLDRFLVTEDTQSQIVFISPLVREFIQDLLPESRQLDLHQRAAEMYRNQRRAL